MKNRLEHKFVRNIPEILENGVIYISIEFGTALHNCCCGCGEEVVTPLTPTDWEIIYDGKSISLDPSIGNWSLDCQSHYWIKKNKVIWAEKWSDQEIEDNRGEDRINKELYYQTKHKELKDQPHVKISLWVKIKLKIKSFFSKED